MTRFNGPRELVVATRPDVSARAAAAGMTSLAGVDVSDVNAILAAAGASIEPLFGVSEDRLELAAQKLSTSGKTVPVLSRYYRVRASDDALDALAESLRKAASVEAAYVKPRAEPPQFGELPQATASAPATTPDFSPDQGYLEAAPGGIDARYAWTFPGGKGAGINIVDVEGAWNFAHEDLLANQGGAVGGTPSTDPSWINHGTAVLGIFSGDDNAIGVTGICPDANVSGISIFGPTGSSGAIHAAADRLAAGDIMLIELHRPGPRFNFQSRDDQSGYIAIEWWPDDRDAIRYAVTRGVIVVEAAGNGAENLDDNIYDVAADGFPPGWINPFRRTAGDSGAVLVGAGAPPPGTHGNNFGADRSRLSFSNYGSALDAQGWGAEVTSTGMGDLQGGANPNVWYTNAFNGTSSASPIVVGALGSAQGVMKTRGAPLTPASARSILRATGSLQQDGPNGPAAQRIGNRPDLRQIIGPSTTTVPVPLYRYWNSNSSEHFYTTDWGELGAGKFGWVFETIQCNVDARQAGSNVPLYRYWNSNGADHFYTTNYDELGSGKFGWVFESVQCYVYAQPKAGVVPLYRYWNSNGADHFYTTDWNELGNGKYGWIYELIQCYVYPPSAQQPPAGPPVEPSTMPSSFDISGANTLAIPQTFATAPVNNGAANVPQTFRRMGT